MAVRVRVRSQEQVFSLGNWEKDWVAWHQSEGRKDGRLCSCVRPPYRAVCRWVPQCLCWTLHPHGQFWSCIDPWDQPTQSNLQIALGQVCCQEGAPALPILRATHSEQEISFDSYGMHISEGDIVGGPLLPAQAAVSLGWNMGLCGPDTDSSGPCCDLWLLQEPMNSELAANLKLYCPSPESPWGPTLLKS